MPTTNVLPIDLVSRLAALAPGRRAGSRGAASHPPGAAVSDLGGSGPSSSDNLSDTSAGPSVSDGLSDSPSVDCLPPGNPSDNADTVRLTVRIPAALRAALATAAGGRGVGLSELVRDALAHAVAGELQETAPENVVALPSLPVASGGSRIAPGDPPVGHRLDQVAGELGRLAGAVATLEAGLGELRRALDFTFGAAREGQAAAEQAGLKVERLVAALSRRREDPR